MEQPIPPPIVPVRRRSRIMTIVLAVVIIVAVAFGLDVLYCAWMVFIPHRGTVTNVSALHKVYNKAGPQIAATFTNSLIQQFPFTGPIDWRLFFFKDPCVVLVGKVDTNALHQFISSHPDTRFLWSGAGNEIEEGWPSGKEYARTTWTNIWFHTEKVVEEQASVIEGTVDFSTCMATVRSYGSGEPVSTNK